MTFPDIVAIRLEIVPVSRRLVNQPGHIPGAFTHVLAVLLQNLPQLHHITPGPGAVHQLSGSRFHAAPGVHRPVHDLPMQAYQLPQILHRVLKLRVRLLQGMVHLIGIRFDRKSTFVYTTYEAIVAWTPGQLEPGDL